MDRLLTLAAMALAALTGTRIAAQQTSSAFVVGIWGQDDAIVPFADYDGQRWRSSWPPPVSARVRFRTLEQIPRAWWGSSSFQPTWEVLERGGTRRGVQLTGTRWAGIGSNCSFNLALETNLPTATYHYATVLASNRPGVIEPVQELTSDARDWRTVAALLPEFYRRYEAQIWEDIGAFRPDLTKPLSGPNLRKAYAFSDDLGQYVHFDSVREYARRPGQQGEGMSFIAGWLWRRSATSAFQVVAIEPGITDGDGKGPSSFQPLGVLRHGAQRFWLGSLSSYAYGALTVFDVRRAGVKQLLLVEYPGC